MASRSTGKTDRIHPRAVIKALLIALALIVLVFPHVLARFFFRHAPFSRYFLQLSTWLAGVDVQRRGDQLRRDVLYIVNHVSWLDILILGGQSGCAFVAKADMDNWPLLGWMARLNNTVYVRRDKRLDAAAQRDAIQNALLSQQAVALFPEGTTSNGLELLPFRSSLFASVSPPPEGIAIQPVAIDYGAQAQEIAWVDEEPVGQNALRVMGRKGRMAVTLHFLAPLDHADFNDRKAMSAHSWAEITAALGLN